MHYFSVHKVASLASLFNSAGTKWIVDPNLQECEVRNESDLNPDTVAALEKGEVLVPHAPIATCPIEASLGLLGKKWTLLVLRDVAMRKKERFNELMKALPGLSPRILSRRLRELESHGLLSRTVERNSPETIRWRVTEKGWDALPILFSYVAFGSKWYPDRVFTDGQPRSVKEQYPSPVVQRFFINLDVKKKPGRQRSIRQAAKW
jgi:DNA-binding HxlR family transcriptional regulator